MITNVIPLIKWQSTVYMEVIKNSHLRYDEQMNSVEKFQQKWATRPQQCHDFDHSANRKDHNAHKDAVYPPQNDSLLKVL